MWKVTITNFHILDDIGKLSIDFLCSVVVQLSTKCHTHFLQCWLWINKFQVNQLACLIPLLLIIFYRHWYCKHWTFRTCTLLPFLYSPNPDLFVLPMKVNLLVYLKWQVIVGIEIIEFVIRIIKQFINFLISVPIIPKPLSTHLMVRPCTRQFLRSLYLMLVCMFFIRRCHLNCWKDWFLVLLISISFLKR